VRWGAHERNLVSGRAALAVRDGIEVDAADLRCTPFRARPAVQAEGVCARSMEDAVESNVGHGEELVVFRGAGGDLLWSVVASFLFVTGNFFFDGVCE
jgi:hypothetical protein